MALAARSNLQIPNLTTQAAISSYFLDSLLLDSAPNNASIAKEGFIQVPSRQYSRKEAVATAFRLGLLLLQSSPVCCQRLLHLHLHLHARRLQ